MKKIKIKKPNKKENFYWIYAILIVVLIAISLFEGSNSSSKTIDINRLDKLVKDSYVEEIIIVNKKIAKIFLNENGKKELSLSKKKRGVFSTSKTPDYVIEIGFEEVFGNKLNDWAANYNLKYNHITEENWFGGILSWIFPILIFVGIWYFLMKRMSGNSGSMGGGPGGMFNIGKSRAKIFDKEKQDEVTFKDVAGMEGAKEEVQEIVEFLSTPKKFTNLGGKIPRGALLVGPPGTGKTLLAKAVAGEAKVPFFSLSGSDFVEMFVGVGASRVRDLFRQAKEKSPCIIFIDEIDAIGRARGKGLIQGANDERENTLNQLLTEMDGFGTNTGVIVLAATNRADVLDRALIRAGRFDRQIHVDLPELHERLEIFKVHLKLIKYSKNLDIEFLAKQTPGFSGADIANICNEAALVAARKDHKVVEKQDFLDAIDRIIAGLEKKNKIITDLEKRIIAFHEAGHAAVSWLVKYASPLVKVTIIPRGRSLGAAWYLPEERQINTTEQMFDEMCAALGGRASEELVFGKVSTGALSDLEKVTKMAYAMVSIYGLSPKIGNISYYDSTGQTDYSFTKPYSNKVAELIDEEVSSIIKKAYKKALEILTKEKEKLTELADLLLKKEVIFSDDLEKIFGVSKYAEELKFEKKVTKRPESPSKEARVVKEPKIVKETATEKDSKATEFKS